MADGHQKKFEQRKIRVFNIEKREIHPIHSIKSRSI